MDTSSLSNFESLTEIGLGGGVDMRPTLLRVLTDLYVQKLTHTPDEEQHYTELALRLLESVDVPTRVAVAGRLAHHLQPPAQVMRKLAADLPQVAAALRPDRHAETPGPAAVARPHSPIAVVTKAAQGARGPVSAPGGIAADVASELNERFFAADAYERRLILLNLDIVVAATAEGSGVGSDPTIGRKLEAAALARRRHDFAHELARSLSISPAQAQRVAGDMLGEPIVVAAKALSIPRDLLYRILLFVNTAVGHSVERVHALAALYDDMSAQAAHDLVGVWQALNADKNEREARTYRPLQADEQSAARPAPAVRRGPVPLQSFVRRNAS